MYYKENTIQDEIKTHVSKRELIFNNVHIPVEHFFQILRNLGEVTSSKSIVEVM